MKRSDFKQLVADNILIFDGALGTMIQQSVPQKLDFPEQAVTKHPRILSRIHVQYAEAGCNVILTNTFGANRLKLGNYGCESEVEPINTKAAALVRKAVEEFPDVLVAGDIGPTGKLLAPLGPLSFVEAVDVFRQQAAALAAGGVDLILIETMSDVHEAKAAAIGARDACALPIVVSMTYGEDLHTLTGATPESAAVVLDALDIDGIGANCGFGPEMFAEILRQYAQVTDLPLLAEPNAGLPHWCDGSCSFNLSAEDMSACVVELVDAGAACIGGCCGTTPEHLAAMAQVASSVKPVKRVRDGFTRLAGTTQVVVIGDGPTRVIGECINVSAKKSLVEAVSAGNYGPIADEAIAQYEAGADIVDVNMGLKLQTLTEEQAMVESVMTVQRVVGCPISIDTVDSHTLEAALQVYRGKALINSTNGDDAHLNRTLALARRYGASVIGLTLDHSGLPKTADERFAIAEKIVIRARNARLKSEDVLIDTLTMTAGSSQDQVRETLEAVRLVRQRLQVRTVLGVSNISHGLPNRADMTASFITLAIKRGLDVPIVNPKLRSVWSAIHTADVLTGRDKNADRYIHWAAANDMSTTEAASARTDGDRATPEQSTLIAAIVKGDKSGTLGFVGAMREHGVPAPKIVNEHLVPALEQVGERYENRTFFLPQLLSAAEAAQAAFDALADDLAKESNTEVGTFVLATVKGDMHDIGKNIVGVMLRNHGFRVIDLGRDVPAEVIVETAMREQADLVGLSSLMTTTMGEMQVVADRFKEEGITAPLMVGGAVITSDYAKMIGAHYSSDAVDAVRVAKKLVGK